MKLTEESDNEHNFNLPRFVNKIHTVQSDLNKETRKDPKKLKIKQKNH